MRNLLLPITLRQGQISTSASPRKMRLAVYAIAFGLGLTIAFLATRNSAHPTTPQGALQSVSRHTVASAPEGIVTILLPPPSAPVRTRPMAPTSGMRPMPDTFEDAISRQTRHPSAVSVQDSPLRVRHTTAYSVQPLAPSPTTPRRDSRALIPSATEALPVPAEQASDPQMSGDSAQSGPPLAVPEPAPPPSLPMSPAPDVSGTGAAGVQPSARMQGTLTAVSVDTQRFTAQGITGPQEFRITPQTMVYAGSERIAFSRMTEFIGTRLTVWSASASSDQVAGRVVFAPAPATGPVPSAAGGGSGGGTDAASGRGGSTGISGGGNGGGSGSGGGKHH